VLPPAVRRDAGVVGVEVSLCARTISRCLGMLAGCRSRQSNLDNGDDELGRVVELGHVDDEMAQLVPLGLVQDQTAPLTHGVDAAQVAGRVQVGVWRPRQRDVGQAGILRRVAVCALHRHLGLEIAVAGVVGVGVRVFAFAREEAHVAADSLGVVQKRWGGPGTRMRGGWHSKICLGR